MKKEEFKPYVPADKITSELTATSVIMGILLAIIFGAANAYLGLRVGMTVSASIPAAVISMGVIRVIMKKDSILESNIVQTIGSAGESLAAGAIFTLPVLFLWAKDGVTETPSLLTIALISLCGGVLGVLFMVPLRKALIVKEHGILPYPEGTACAKVLLAGEEGGAGAKSVFVGMGLAAAFKFVVDGLKVVPGVITAPIKGLKTEFSVEVYPALLGVGYICGPKISSYLFAGGLIGWFVLIPAIITFGSDTVLYPGTDTIANMYAIGGASAVWSSYIRYIGAGAVAAGGIISLVKSLPLIVSTFIDAIKGMKGEGKRNNFRTAQDMDMKAIMTGIALMVVAIWLLPQIPVTFPGALFVVIFGFFFATVSSRMVGLVGSSNNPVSGMAIATLLFATLALKATGNAGIQGMTGAIAIGSVICIVAAMAGDTSQDLKTGYILGATPRKQQIGELIGAVVSALTIGGVLVLFNLAWGGYGTAELSAPQATLMKMIVEGVMEGNLPWALVLIGVFIAIALEVLKIPVLPVAIGLYLPMELSSTIMVGGIIKWFADKKNQEKEENKEANSGILFCSGLIAGEGLMGILLAILAVVNVAGVIDLSAIVNTGIIGGIVLLVIMIFCIMRFAMQGKGKASGKDT
ncbi:MAG: oligopeptide transporter, OPT family [Lachnospiraceae bacterium]|nr:oligopeptide transporter, OPT family [Lachnospiraceae bacterium]